MQVAGGLARSLQAAGYLCEMRVLRPSPTAYAGSMASWEPRTGVAASLPDQRLGIGDEVPEVRQPFCWSRGSSGTSRFVVPVEGATGQTLYSCNMCVAYYVCHVNLPVCPHALDVTLSPRMHKPSHSSSGLRE